MIEKNYRPEEFESQIYASWREKGYFAPKWDGQPYCIMLPPPNITGNLHMGHAFQHTLIDILIRYHRMSHRDTLWQAGVDHAGIATQMVVERQLEKQGLKRQDLGREKFLETVWDWKKYSGNTIINQAQRVGTAMDWNDAHFTMDAKHSQAVLQAFIQLYQDGLIYRGKRLVNWDPVLHTAISDLEVIKEEEAGFLWYIRYPLERPQANCQHLIVATTRPETILGDMAVAVHPEDERYQSLIGEHVRLPLTQRKIPIIADKYVDPSFGSGCVKITPAHDFNDYEVGKRHNLECLNIFTKNATINDLAPKDYRDLDRYEARKRIISDLKAQNLLEKTLDHQLMIPRGDRSHAVIEPYLTDQWYIKSGILAKAAIDVVESGEIEFLPSHWRKTYFEWMHHIEDWCISRQLWWGHRIPVWYDDAGNHYVGSNEEDVRKKYRLDATTLHQDEDVLDTWFSSALWPFSTLGWPNKTTALDKFFPTDVLVTGFDIIFFWVARMIMMSLKLTGQVPFRKIYVHGLVRDANGQKMSKSKGNIIDPLDLIDGISLDKLIDKRTTGLMQPQMASRISKETRLNFPEGISGYGTDSLRFTFASLATQGRDIRFDIGRINGYRNFCNKIWNASRYVLMQLNKYPDIGDQGALSVADRWIESILSRTLTDVYRSITEYRFDLMAKALYEFTWYEYCDWYLEFAKAQLNDPMVTRSAQQATISTLLHVLEKLLRALHPIMPFITEQLWLKVTPSLALSQDSILQTPYPTADQIDEDAETQINWIKTLIAGIRCACSENQVSPSKRLDVVLVHINKHEKKWLADHQHLICSLARLAEIRISADTPAEAYIMFPLDKMRVFILQDEEDHARAQKKIAKLKQEYDHLSSILDNQDFINKAPEKIVSKNRERLIELSNMLMSYEKEK